LRRFMGGSGRFLPNQMGYQPEKHGPKTPKTQNPKTPIQI